MKPVYTRAMQQLAGGADLDGDFAKKVLKKLKDAGVELSGLEQAAAIGAMGAMARQIAGRDGLTQAQQNNLRAVEGAAGREASNRARKIQEERQEREEQDRQRRESPRRHQDRQELRGGGRKQMDAKAKLNSMVVTGRK